MSAIALAGRQNEIFEEHLFNHRKQLDKILSLLLIAHWIAALFFALVISPSTWIGKKDLVHLHVWIALIQGGIMTIFPLYLAFTIPGKPVTRYVIAVSQCLFASLFVHLTGGRIETHFHYFGSLAFLAFYRDWKVLLLGTVFVAVDHFLRGMFWTLSVYGIENENHWRWIEHAAWVVVMDIVLFLGIFRGTREVEQISQSQAEVENYSQNMEGIVEVRTKELSESRGQMSDILKNVNQGILTLDKDGRINSEFSGIVPVILGKFEPGIFFWDLFPAEELNQSVKDYVNELQTNEFMSEKMFKDLNPISEINFLIPEMKIIRNLSFSFSRIQNEKKEIEKILVVIDDKTDQMELTRKLEQATREQTAKIEKLYQILNLEPKIFEDFMKESKETVDYVRKKVSGLNISNSVSYKDALLNCMREVHTLKGNARALNLDSIANTAHSLENTLSITDLGVQELNSEKLNSVMEMANTLESEINDGSNLFQKIIGMKDILHVKKLDSRSELEDRCRKLVEQDAIGLGKKVQLEFKGEIYFKSEVLLKVRNMLGHLLRNSLDHGVETIEERLASGKPEIGKLSVTISTNTNGEVEVVVEDDGKGINYDAVLAKARETGFVKPENEHKTSRSDLIKLMFKAGFSTAKRVSEISGRGVGLSAVQEDMKSLGGQIQVSSDPGKYTRFTLKIKNAVA